MKAFIIQKLLFPLVRIYWKVFKPKTFGVKGIVVRSSDQAILFVRHAYGNTAVWNLPGGGYKPRKESAAQAVAREINEELGLIIESPIELGEYKTQAQGKRDTVTILLTDGEDRAFKLSNEISEARWISHDEVKALKDLYPITRYALKLHANYLSRS